MTKTQHTAGPWECTYSPYTSQDGEEIPAFEIIGDEKICDTNENQPRDEQQANAWLIAGAPDLLDALEAQTDAAQAVVDAWERGDLAAAVHILEGCISPARTVIAAARGGAQ